MQQAFQNWSNWMLTLGKSRATQAGYSWEMRQLIRRIPDKGLDDYRADDLLAYLALRRATCGDAAIKRAVNALRSFFAFCLKERSPAAELSAPRPKKRLQRTLSLEQSFAVLAACDTSSPIGVRDVALMTLMLDSGIRAAEVCRLAIDKLDLGRRVFCMIVKGGHEASGIFGPETASFAARWLAVREGLAAPGVSTVFVGIGGLTPGRPLTTDGLRRIFHRVGRAAGLAHFSPHDLRRTFATTMTLLKAPSRLAQLWGRWGNLQEFERYTQALLEMQNMLRDEFDPYSPVRAALNIRGKMGSDRAPA